MKKCLLFSVLSLVLAMTWASEGFAQSQKEIDISGTNYNSSSDKLFQLDQDQIIVQFETPGVRVNDSGEGPFHGSATHIVGVFYMGKSGAKLRAFETWTDKDGDKLIWELVEKVAKDLPPGSFSGTAKVFAATGKFVGYQGTMDWIIKYPKSFPEGTGRGICKEAVKLVPPN
jgi:hypothetical protein